MSKVVMVHFKRDRTRFSGRSAEEVVRKMMHQSHDMTSDPTVYMKAVARRAFQMYQREVRTENHIEFLRDLERVGEGRVLKVIL